MPENRLNAPPHTPELQAGVDLARKYARNGPRYTSYPTAAQFTEQFPLGECIDTLGAQAQGSKPLSLYLHLPFCQDICYYCACNKIVTRDKTRARGYLDHLTREIEQQSRVVGSQRPVTQMHWGGGTPTFLDNAELTELMYSVASHFHLLDDSEREYAIELDPRTVDKGTIALLKGLGFNRVSLGIQDLDPLVQKAINRIQPLKLIESLVENIRDHEFRSLNFDLIYGLPHQDCESLEGTLRRVTTLAPDRIAAYNYAHLPERFPSQRTIDRQVLPPPAEKLLMQQVISQRLQDAGYIHIGMDHYVLPTDDLAQAFSQGRLHRNFQGYSLHLADDLLGLGVSAISELGDYYLQNARDINTYFDLVQQGAQAATRGCKITSEDRLRRHIIMSLISGLELDIPDCERRFGINFKQVFHAELGELNDMESDGLLAMENDKITVTRMGRTFLRNICMPFDAYLPGQSQQQTPPGFSATL